MINHYKRCPQVRKRVFRSPLGFFCFGRKIRIAIPQLRLQYTRNVYVLYVRANVTRTKNVEAISSRSVHTIYIPFSSQRCSGNSVFHSDRVYTRIILYRSIDEKHKLIEIALVSRGQMRSNSGRKEIGDSL